MSVLKFAEEFTRLVIRYTRTSSPNNDFSNAVTPLTDEQIAFTIHHVLQALAIKGFEKKNNPSEVSDSASAVTPETSVIKIKQEQDIENTCSSQDVQSVVADDSSVSDISLKAMKKEREDSFNKLQNEKKFISRSNPAICINISRSDTFVREENRTDTEDQDDVFKDFTDALSNETDDLSSDLFQVSLSDIRKSAMDIMAKLNRLERSLFPQSTRLSKEGTTKVQQSSLIHGRYSPHRVSTINKTKSTNTHKSSAGFSKTPTPSKLFATENENISERRKSTGAVGTNAAPIRKSGESIKDRHSISNLTLSPCKASPGLSEFRPKYTKNPKYAHIRSTIPKAINQKKKVQ